MSGYEPRGWPEGGGQQGNQNRGTPVGAQRELMRLEAAIGILVPLLVSWSVWSQAGQRHLVLYAFLLALVSAALHLAHVGPRRLVQWAVRESQRPWPRFL
ncbi:hypothetical protein HJ590_05440 [Naumannella sp. ID2617S]|nr:hypothetical protein [Naumannella sp. ID2617S]